MIVLSEKETIASTKLEVTSGIFLRIWIWDNIEKMQKHTALEGDEYSACFIAPKEWDEFVGIINLVEGEFGGGIFAHELQHFIQYWIWRDELDPMGDDWESIAYLAGDITNKFWTWFYNNFEVEESNVN